MDHDNLANVNKQNNTTTRTRQPSSMLTRRNSQHRDYGLKSTARFEPSYCLAGGFRDLRKFSCCQPSLRARDRYLQVDIQ